MDGQKKRLIRIVGGGIVIVCVAMAMIRGIGLFGAGGASRVSIAKTESGYHLKVDNEPYFIKGMVYQPIPIGQDHNYNFWNDPHEAWRIDGPLMKQLGVNTVRFYQPGENSSETKTLMSILYKRYGIRTIMGHWLGFWESPDYSNERIRARLKDEVIAMVETYKNDHALLYWVLGNENNFSFGAMGWNTWTSPDLQKITNPAQRQRAMAAIYYAFVNELAQEIKQRDPNHPVAMGHGELQYIELAAQYCPDVDILGVASYRGKGFGNLWREVDRRWKKPLFLTEFGCDSFNAWTQEEDEDIQATFIEAQWKEIFDNRAEGSGVGNCLGGCVFEWTDEWWKHDEHNRSNWYIHDKEGEWSNGSFYFDIRAPRNMNMNEEWFGLMRLEKDPDVGIDKRIPKKAYSTLKQLWTGKQ